jgi:hypothetical protein
MKFSLVITLVFVFFLPISVYVLYNSFIKDASITGPNNTIAQPGDSGITLPLSNGGSVDVENFLALPEVSPDANNQNEYYLGNSFEDYETSEYIVTFDAETKYFNIALLKKPLATSRQAVEAYMKKTLNLSESQLCELNYTVSVPGYIDEAASGIDYRFSFCPGSVQL